MSSITPNLTPNEATIVVLGSSNVDLITYCHEFPKNGGKNRVKMAPKSDCATIRETKVRDIR